MHIFFIFIIPVCSKFHVRIQLCSDANSKTKISFAAKGAPQGEVERKNIINLMLNNLEFFDKKNLLFFRQNQFVKYCKIFNDFL